MRKETQLKNHTYTISPALLQPAAMFSLIIQETFSKNNHQRPKSCSTSQATAFERKPSNALPPKALGFVYWNTSLPQLARLWTLPAGGREGYKWSAACSVQPKTISLQNTVQSTSSPTCKTINEYTCKITNEYADSFRDSHYIFCQHCRCGNSNWERLTKWAPFSSGCQLSSLHQR